MIRASRKAKPKEKVGRWESVRDDDDVKGRNRYHLAYVQHHILCARRNQPIKRVSSSKRSVFELGSSKRWLCSKRTMKSQQRKVYKYIERMKTSRRAWISKTNSLGFFLYLLQMALFWKNHVQSKVRSNLLPLHSNTKLHRYFLSNWKLPFLFLFVCRWTAPSILFKRLHLNYRYKPTAYSTNQDDKWMPWSTSYPPISVHHCH